MTASVDDELSRPPMLPKPAVVAPASESSSRFGRFLLFGAIGLSGFAPNLACLFILNTILGMHYVFATVIATQVAIVWNFLLLERFVYRRARTEPWFRRSLAFAALNNADLVLRIPLLAILIEHGHMHCIVATIITLVAMFVVRFIVTDRVIYRLRQRLS